MTLLVQRVRTALMAVADPARAPAMQAYMKSAMPYLGISAVPLRTACKTLFANLHYETSAKWQADVLMLWRSAQYREERYAALALSGIRAARGFQRMDALAMYEEMIVTGAWWDFIDPIAGQRLAAILATEGQPMKQAMRNWARSDDMWKRRSAILCQLNAKGQTDLDLLYACIAPSLDSREFFLRKAIGWALRQYARVDAAEVTRYMTSLGDKLSPLSQREAMKHIDKLQA